MAEMLFWVTYGALWVLVVTLAAAIFFLYRYHGRMLLASQEGRAAQGPPLGESLPDLPLRDLTKATIRLAQPGGPRSSSSSLRQRAGRAKRRVPRWLRSRSGNARR